MLKDITIGQYFPGDSIVHKLDPRIKIIIIGLFIASLFFINSFFPYIFILLFIGTVIKVANLPVKYILKGLKPLVFILLITLVINIFMTKGEVLFYIGPLTVTKEGLSTADYFTYFFNRWYRKTFITI